MKQCKRFAGPCGFPHDVCTPHGRICIEDEMTEPKLYQAGIGPDMRKLHIYAPNPDSPVHRPSLCEAVNIVRNYRGSVSASRANLCKRCFRILENSLEKGEAITAELIGVSDIID